MSLPNMFYHLLAILARFFTHWTSQLSSSWNAVVFNQIFHQIEAAAALWTVEKVRFWVHSHSVVLSAWMVLRHVIFEINFFGEFIPFADRALEVGISEVNASDVV